MQWPAWHFGCSSLPPWMAASHMLLVLFLQCSMVSFAKHFLSCHELVVYLMSWSVVPTQSMLSSVFFCMNRHYESSKVQFFRARALQTSQCEVKNAVHLAEQRLSPGLPEGPEPGGQQRLTRWLRVSVPMPATEANAVATAASTAQPALMLTSAASPSAKSWAAM
jgi:hypothetical protein